jgi:H/ACA ribonucleoprotein complex subunit 3
MTDLFLDGKKIQIDVRKALGKGGEADVYEWNGTEALKIYKDPDHPDYTGFPEEQFAAEQRMRTIGTKLKDFPKQLPEHVIKPLKLVTDKTGKLVYGYTMPLVKPAEALMNFYARAYREQNNIPHEVVLDALRDLRALVKAVHRAGVVIGDFNDLNVLVKDTQTWLIDADSFQYGRYICPMFTARFVDPTHCGGVVLDPGIPHNAQSDWYAYAVMLFQALLNVHPYGGIHKPKDPKNRIPQELRALRRVTVFDPEVVYPKPAWPYRMLPDETLQYFHRVFEKDERGECPQELVDGLHFQTCPYCKQLHARKQCPDCAIAVPKAASKTVIRAHGHVTQRRIFTTDGALLYATVQNGKVLYLYHENGKFVREDGQTICTGPRPARLRTRLQGVNTLLGQAGNVLLFEPNKAPQKLAVDMGNSEQVFEANAQHRYWMRQGQLVRNGTLGEELIGEALQGQTHIFVGPKFGLGFYRAGQLSTIFTFDAIRRGINDQIKLTGMTGHWIATRVTFSEECCWFYVQLKQQQQVLNKCWVLDAQGKLLGQAETVDGDGTWLGSLSGKTAAGPFGFSITDDGLVRVKPAQGSIVLDKTYPDTEPFVREGLELLVSSEGLITASARELHLLNFSQAA